MPGTRRVPVLIFLLLLTTLCVSTPRASAASYPTVTATLGGFTTSATSHLIYLPVDAVKGDLLIACIDSNVATTLTWPSGWNPLFSPAQAPTGVQIECRFRTDDLSTSFITVTFGSAGADAHIVYRITGWNDLTSPSAAIPVGGTSTNPDPPSLTVSPSEDRLFIIVYGWWVATHSAYPANYNDNQVVANQGVNAYLAMASRDLTGTTDNPGTATISASNPWIATTISVRPAQVTPGKLFVNILANPDEGQQPLVVQFYSNVTGGTPPYSYFWVFGDGVVSTSASPAHTFSLNGTYTIELTVQDNATIKDLVTDTYSVHVRALPAVDFTPFWIILVLLILAFAAFLVIAWYDDSVAWFFPAGVVAQFIAFEGWTITASLYVALSLSVVGIVTLLVPIGHALRGRPS